MSHSVWPWVLLVGGVAAAIGLIAWLRRRHYLARLSALGWTNNASPGLTDVARLKASPRRRC